jgi:hypothetical protein
MKYPPVTVAWMQESVGMDFTRSKVLPADVW